MHSLLRVSLVVSIVFAVMTAVPQTPQAADVILNHFGFLYETNGFPTSDIGDTLAGLGNVTNVNYNMGWDYFNHEVTWVIKNLVSQGQTSPDGGRTLIINYVGGEIGIYSDSTSNRDWGINPPNTTAPSTFEDGTQFLIGAFTQFVLVYDTYYQIGAYQGVVSFTAGTELSDLPEPNGLVFAGTLGPALDPNIPQGYSLESVGQIVAPHICNARGNASFDCPNTCVQCNGIAELVLTYTGSYDINTVVVSGADVMIDGNQLIIIPSAGNEELPEYITVQVGCNWACINTSCKRKLDPGNVIGKFTVASVDKIMVPCAADCEGIAQLTIEYLGHCNPNTVSASSGATAYYDGEFIIVEPQAPDTKLSKSTKIYVGDCAGGYQTDCGHRCCDTACIPTDCKQPLDVGMVFGEFEIVDIEEIPGGDPGLPLGGPVIGATVDLVDSEGNSYSTTTDELGNYYFEDVAGETLQVSISIPLGFTPVTETNYLRIVQPGGTGVVDFDFLCQRTVGEPRARDFWKHQVNYALKGKTRGIKYTGEELMAFMDTLQVHFTPHFGLYEDVYTLEDMRWALSDHVQFTKTTNYFQQARAQLLAVLLNIISGRSAQWQYASTDSRTISQAITYVADCLEDADARNDKNAKLVAKAVVHGLKVGAGVIPANTPIIAYAFPRDHDDIRGEDDRPGKEDPDDRDMILDFTNFPNPFNPVTTIYYRLDARTDVSIAVYNVNGQKVRDLVSSQSQEAGVKAVVWDSKDNSGRDVASGVYFSRIITGNRVFTKRMVLIR